MDEPDRPRSVILRNQHDAQGTRHLDATLTEDGSIVIEGWDLGAGVEAVWGEGLREYEWAWTVAPGDVPAAVAALGGAEGDDPLALLGAWLRGHRGRDPGSHLRDAGILVEFWSRVGD
jgi:hypothetical protein